jgi:NADP-dependent 3-hydroxy acid dehydrogenase YdfG
LGIGAALATILVDEVAEVSAADRQIGPAQELAQRLNSVGGKAHVIELDVRSYPSFECSRPRCRCGLRWSCSSACLN